MREALVVAGFLTAFAALPVVAQDTNLTIYQELALECLRELPSEVDTLSLDAWTQMPYLRTALVESWKSGGHEVYALDNSPPQAASLPRLTIAVEDASVAYSVADRRRLNRRVRLGLQYVLTGPDGRIILDDRCSRTASDTIYRSAVAQLEDQAYTETQGELPRAGWLRRIVEPAVIAGATAVGVYLFFTLRSQSADD